MKIEKLFCDGKTKALSFSYDDGVFQNLKLVPILNHYGVKATFNLHSGLMSPALNTRQFV